MALVSTGDIPPPHRGPTPEAVWIVYDGGKKLGPFTLEALASLLQNGVISRDASVWRDGMAQWEPLSSILDLPAEASPLDQLALAAVNVPNFAPPAKKRAIQSIGSARTPHILHQQKRRLLLAFVVAGVIAFITVFICVLVGSSGHGFSPGIAAVLRITPYSETAQMTRQVTGWSITNTSEMPVTIQSVVFNGEFSPQPARWKGGWIFPDKDGPFPSTLSIGESAIVIGSENFIAPIDEALYYPKEVIFFDIYTDQGSYRYRPSTRTFDRENLTRDDEKISEYMGNLESTVRAKLEQMARDKEELDRQLKGQDDAAQQRAAEFERQSGGTGQTPAQHIR